MFVQVIEGRVVDATGLHAAMDRWNAELRPQAQGFLGSTGGVADDGHGIAFARFESAAAAQANSDRPEQGQWWDEAKKCFAGDVSFSNSEDVDTFLGGGSDDSRFVQVVKMTGVDQEALRPLDDAFLQHAPSWRPDFLGGVRVWTGPDSYVEASYFTNENEARQGEAKEPPAEMAPHFDTYQTMMANAEFIDLRDPWLY